MKRCLFTLGPSQKVWTPQGAKGGHPSICREQSIFFIYKGIYMQNIMTLLLLVLEKKIFKVCPLFTLWGPIPGPPGVLLPHMKNFGSLPPKDDPHKVWLKSVHRFWRIRWKRKKLTDNKQKRMPIAHLSLLFRRAKNKTTFNSTWLFWCKQRKSKLALIQCHQHGSRGKSGEE